MKNTRWTILAALLLAATSVAHAQAPVDPAAPATPTVAATPDSGIITNSQTIDTTSTTTSAPGIGAEGMAMEGDASTTGETTELANTGGEPILMSLVGLSMAMGAFALRKRVSA